MAAADVQTPAAEPAPALPDYLTDPDATLKDADAKWRYGRAPDYSKTRKVFEETKQMSHAAGSLPELVQNLVKNWEVEASFKTSLDDWRTIDRPNYSFAINSSAPQTGEHMLKLGTYNAIISPNEYYSPEYSDFASSHKTFKRMMPTFAWEVLEVYSGPPTVSFRWRHWGVMKNDYVGFNNKGEKVTAPAHGQAIDIQGVTIATVNEAVQLQSVRTWFDPLDMFRQIAPNGVVKKEAVDKKLTPDEALDAVQHSVEISTEARIKSGEAGTAMLEEGVVGNENGSGDGEERKDGEEVVDGVGMKLDGEAERLVESVGCPFAGTDPEAARELFAPEKLTGNENAESVNGGGDKGWEELKTGSGCPFAANATFVKE